VGIAKVLKRLHYPLDVMLLRVRWYAAYSLSLRDLEGMIAERAIGVDHRTVRRWVIKWVFLAIRTSRSNFSSTPRDLLARTSAPHAQAWQEIFCWLRSGTTHAALALTWAFQWAPPL
jgi:hypothetical protein